MNARILALFWQLIEVPQSYKSLSGGQKRCVQFALAIAGNPEILFLDEPSTGLDHSARQTLWRVIADFAQQGKTIILTTHYIEEAEHLAKRIVLLKDGIIERDDSTKTLLTECRYDVIHFRCNADISSLNKLAHCVEVSFIEGFATLRTDNSIATLRDLLTLDCDLSQLSIQRPTLASILHI